MKPLRATHENGIVPGAASYGNVVIVGFVSQPPDRSTLIPLTLAVAVTEAGFVIADRITTFQVHPDDVDELMRSPVAPHG